MAVKKKESDNKADVLDKLKKYNDDLDKYLPKMNFDFLKDDHIFDEDYLSNQSNYSSGSRKEPVQSPAFMHGDLSTLVANNIIDVKSEVVLLRKNILDNVSSIVMKVTSEQQDQFLRKLNDVYTTLNLNYRESLASSVSELYGELSNIRGEVDKISVSNKRIVNTVEDFSQNFGELKSIMNDLNDFKRKFTATGGIDTITKKFSVIEERLSRVIKNNELQIDKFVTVLKNNNEKIDAVLDSVSSNKYKHFSNDSFSKDESSSSSFVSSKLDERLNKLLLDDGGETVSDPIKRANMAEFEKSSSSKSLDDDWDNYDLNSEVNSIIQIDDKLKKLNSLR